MGLKRGIVPIALLAAVVVGVVVVASVRLFAQDIDNRPIGNDLLAGICNVNPNFSRCQPSPSPTPLDGNSPTPSDPARSIPRPSCAPPSVLTGDICIDPTPSPPASATPSPVRLRSSPSPMPSVTPNPPMVVTYVPTNITAKGATLRANIYPNGLTTTAWFRVFDSYRPNDGCEDNENGTKVPSPYNFVIYQGSSSSNLTYTVDNLSPNKSYSFCAIAQNAKGKKLGNIVAFITGQ